MILEHLEPIGSAAAEPPAGTAEEARFRAVSEALAEIRPNLQRDGGDCKLVGIEGNLVRIKMGGACIGCQLASVTIHGIQEKLIAKLGFPLRVVPVLGGF